jgi:lactate dehydrogenase-like 2-hydroxyacid dehydrogenase
VCTSTDTILSQDTIKKLLGSRCDGVIGQLTEKWDKELFGALRSAGGTAYSNYAVGYDNVVVPDATAAGVAVGNTPGARAKRARSEEERESRVGATCEDTVWVCGADAPCVRACSVRRAPGVLTETTAETAAALTLAAARRIAEARARARATGATRISLAPPHPLLTCPRPRPRPPTHAPTPTTG